MVQMLVRNIDIILIKVFVAKFVHDDTTVLVEDCFIDNRIFICIYNLSVTKAICMTIIISRER